MFAEAVYFWIDYDLLSLKVIIQQGKNAKFTLYDR